ncbi:MAG: hypothetical protein K8R48_02375 [Alphaproteobacteria bacterium]|nr:hypothetical protein [Alphaproteobacteria bacterium]
MAHDMYGINELLKKYPLVEKAFNKTEAGLEAVFFTMGGEAACTAGPKLIIETIDQNLDGTDAEKQALIIGVMYALDSESFAADKASFEAEYGPEAKPIMDDFLAAQEKFAEDKNAVLPTNVSRVSAVIGICTMISLTSTLKDVGSAGNPIPKQALQQMKNEILKEEAKMLSNLNAPKLEALYQQKKQELFAVLDQTAAPQPKNKKPGGPKA